MVQEVVVMPWICNYSLIFWKDCDPVSEIGANGRVASCFFCIEYKHNLFFAQLLLTTACRHSWVLALGLFTYFEVSCRLDQPTLVGSDQLDLLLCLRAHSGLPVRCESDCR